MTSIFLGLALFSSPQSDGAALLKATTDKLVAANSATGSFEVKFKEDEPGEKWSFKLLKPNFFLLSSKNLEYRFDGDALWMYVPSIKQFTKNEMKGTTKTVAPPYMLGMDVFFSKSSTYKVVSSEPASFGGKTATAVKVEASGSADPITLYIDSEAKLPVGWQQKIGETNTIVHYSDVKLDQPVEKSLFAWTPPKDVKQYQAPRLEAGLLKVDVKAPDFKLENGEKPFVFSEFLKGSKGAIIVFTFIGNEGSKAELDRLKALNSTLKQQGLKLLAINYGDAKEEVEKFASEAALGFPILANQPADDTSVPRLYQVTSYPTTYFIGPDGKIKSRFVEFDSRKLDAVLANAGFKIG